MPKDLIDYATAAELCSTTRRTIERWVKAGKLTRYERPYTGPGGRHPVLLDRKEVEELKAIRRSVVKTAARDKTKI